MMRITSCNDLPELKAYADIVKYKKYPVCIEQRLLLDYVNEIFTEEEIYINTEQLENYLGLQKYFPYSLFEWEVFVFTLHCCTYTNDGHPRWSELFLFCGRGSGKNGYLSFEDFALLTPYNTIMFYDIDICATSEKQARTSFDDIYNVLEDPRHTKKLKKWFYWTKQEIICRQTKSKLQYHTNNAKSKDGLRSAKVDFDEEHQYTGYENIKVFTTGFGKKPHSRITKVTTNGEISEGVLDDDLDKADRILKREEADNGVLPVIFKLDSKEEVDNENNWIKAVPSLPYFPELKRVMKKEYVDYKKGRSSASSFMTKRMGIRDGDTETQLTSWDNIKATNQPIPELSGYNCIVCIDYAKINDFVNAGFLFRIDGKYIFVQHTWVCTQSADYDRIKFPIQEEVEKGEITLIDDLEISADVVCEWIAENRKEYNFVGIALDEYRYALMNKALKNIGFEFEQRKKKDEQMIKLVRPSDKIKVEPIIDSAFINHNIIFGDSRTMRWYCNNVKRVRDKYGNFEYQKIERKARKTDGFFSFAGGMTIVDRIPDEISIPVLPTMVF